MKKISKEKMIEIGKVAAIAGITTGVGVTTGILIAGKKSFKEGFKTGAKVIVVRNNGYGELGYNSFNEFEEYVDTLCEQYIDNDLY